MFSQYHIPQSVIDPLIKLAAKVKQIRESSGVSNYIHVNDMDCVEELMRFVAREKNPRDQPADNELLTTTHFQGR